MNTKVKTFIGMIAGFVVLGIGMATGVEALGIIAGLIVLVCITINGFIEIKKVFFNKA